MTPALGVLLVVFLFGLLIRTWCDSAEARQLRIAALIIQPDADQGEVVSTALDRTRMLLSAIKLLRLFSLFVLATSGSLVAIDLREVAAAGGTPPWYANPLVVDVFAFVALFLILIISSTYGARRAFRRSEQLRENPPAWITDEDVSWPAWVATGWIGWEWLMHSLERFLAVGMRRPQATMYELEDQIRLDVEDIDPESVATPGASTTIQRERTELEMVRAIQRLDSTLVREVMKPINQVTAIRIKDYSPKRLLELARRTGYSRIPVYEDQITNLQGYINIYDLLDLEESPKDLRQLVTKPIFVPEVARVDAIMNEMITRKQQVAIVFDEFGGTSGWLSREDIFEEIVGEVEDEYERPRRKILPVKDWFLVSPTIDLDDLEEEIGLELPKRNCDTIAGYIYQRLGRVPRPGEVLEERGWRIVVSGLDNHRIRRIRAIPPAPEDGKPEE
ncbi:hypothetical protein KQI84_14700 [bacterium]|nr:hypothetical protein [bacterium]